MHNNRYNRDDEKRESFRTQQLLKKTAEYPPVSDLPPEVQDELLSGRQTSDFKRIDTTPKTSELPKEPPSAQIIKKR